jgi:hypothetical protein
MPADRLSVPACSSCLRTWFMTVARPWTLSISLKLIAVILL